MLDHSDFAETDIPFEIPLPEKAYLTVSNHDIPFEILLPEKRHPLSNLCQRKKKVHMHKKKKKTCRKEKKM